MRYALINSGTVLAFIECTSIQAAALQTSWDHVVEAPAHVTIYDKYDNGNFSVGNFEPVAKEVRKVTVLGFLRRFTDAEAIAIDLGSIGATVQAASLRRYVAMVNAAKFVDLDRQDTRNGVLALVGAGILTQERADVILDGPIPIEDLAA